MQVSAFQYLQFYIYVISVIQNCIMVFSVALEELSLECSSSALLKDSKRAIFLLVCEFQAAAPGIHI